MTDPTQPGEPTTDAAAQAAAIAGATTTPPAAPTTPPDPGTSDAGFQAPFNINDVPEAQRPYVEAYAKQLQGAFTRKTQELAELRQQLEPASALYERLHADDEYTRDAALRELMASNGWSDLSEGEQQEAYEAAYEDPATAPPTAADPELVARVERTEQALAARDQADQEAAYEAYLEDFATRYTTAANEWAKTNFDVDYEQLPDHVKAQIAGYVRGVPALVEDGNSYPNMQAALAYMDADRAAYLTSKDAPSPNTGAVTAAPSVGAPANDKERLARSMAIAGRRL